MMLGKSNAKIAILLLMIFFVFLGFSCYAEENSGGIRLLVDGKDITELSEPVIENDRTLVPLRFVSEEIGAEVIWDGEKRSVQINKGEKKILFWIGSHLVDYGDGEFFGISDVAPKIIKDRTYVPLRLLGNALGIGVDWD
ncbi:MAG TPA: copper amine oxidase N-terminal domain-containing protein, partial [Clostridia bacterium]|nr:copper amine oxidase N-terminal domain-containing protein [Clostridia bacterium]